MQNRKKGTGGQRVSWPADKVERWDINKLVPHAKNARIHSDEQIGQIAASIREWGWTNPVLVDESGNLIAGHGRILAARRLGIADVPVMIAVGWTEAQKRAYVLADNKLAENAQWDSSALGEELLSLQSDFDVSLTGFTHSEIDSLVSGRPAVTVHEIETGPVEDRFWISMRGPLALQARALDAVKSAMAQVDGVEIDIGVIAV